MKTLVVDNIDSFVYILVQYLGEAGGDPLVVENTIGEEEVDRLIADEGITHVLISPGPGRPEDAGVSNHLIREYGGKLPMLGICLGHQCIGLVHGAKVTNAKTLMHGKVSQITHEGNGVLSGMKNPFTATRYHSLTIEEPPSELIVTAKSQGDGEIMGVQVKGKSVYGLQFHPESILTEDGMRIIKNFLGDEP